MSRADIVVVVVYDVRVLEVGIDRRKAPQRLHGRLDEEGHEAQAHAVGLLEAPLVACTQRHHRAHVDLVEGREDGRVALRLDEALGDALA